MLAEITEKIAVPEDLAVGERDLVHTVSAGVGEYRTGTIDNSGAARAQAPAKIDIFKPDREETFVEATDGLEGFALDREAGAGGLVHVLGLRVIEIEAAVTAIERIARPQAVEKKYLGGHEGDRREAAHNETTVGLIVSAQQEAADGCHAGRFQSAGQFLQGARGGDGIGIEKQENPARGRLRAAICSGSETEVVRVLNETRLWVRRLSRGDGPVAGGIVDDDALPFLLVVLLTERAQAGLDGAGGVVSHDDDRASRHAERIITSRRVAGPVEGRRRLYPIFGWNLGRKCRIAPGTPDAGAQDRPERKVRGFGDWFCIRIDAASARERSMWRLIRETQQNRELIWALAMKELRVRYKRSALGFLWALLNPLLMMIIYTIVFSAITQTSLPHYSIFLISTLLPWTFFSQSLAYSVDSIVGNGDLLKKVYVAKSVFPIAAVLSNAINFAFSMVPLIVLLIVFRFPFHWTWFYFVVPFTGLALFTLGCSFFFAMANVFFRDMAHILQVILQAWFFLCPIVYSFDVIPGRYRPLFRLNPLLYSLNGFRLAIYYGQLPSAESMAASLGGGLVVLWLGYRLFRRYENTLVFYV